MSYEIFYDKRFIALDDSYYIPIVLHGSNNCFQINHQGRYINEKNWNILNSISPGKHVFNSDEIKEMAKEYDKTGEFYKSRYRKFEKGEFERWFINGMKNAQTVEYYISFGNRLYVSESGGNYSRNSELHHPVTSKELIGLLHLYSDLRWIGIGFVGREIKLPKRSYKKREKVKRSYYYVLHNDGRYFCSLSKYGYRYVCVLCRNVRKFERDVDANKYLEKYKERLQGNWNIKRIDEECMI